MTVHIKKILTLFLLLFVFSFINVRTVSAEQVTGAIFTTDDTCTGVDLNIYALRGDVYLDGGPIKPGPAGLPNGEYYVKVTAPDGTLLGTSVGAVDETPVVVTNKEFASCYKLWDILIKASDATVGYDLTPNNGGEYKVWISTESTFTNSNTKTDNFKVDEDAPLPSPVPTPTPTPIPTARLRVLKFYDANANGINDDGIEIAGWKVSIVNGIEWIRYTFVNMIVEPGVYLVSEFMPIETNWMATTSTSESVTLLAGDDKLVEFGNLCLGAGGGHTKGYWSNKNGEKTLMDGGSLAPEMALLTPLNLRNYGGTHFDPGSYSQYKTWLSSANATNMAYMLSAQLSAMELNVESGMVSGGALVYAPELIGYSVPGMNGLGYISIGNLMTAANTELGLHGVATTGTAWRNYQGALKDVIDSANNNVNFVQDSPCLFTF